MKRAVRYAIVGAELKACGDCAHAMPKPTPFLCLNALPSKQKEKITVNGMGCSEDAEQDDPCHTRPTPRTVHSLAASASASSGSRRSLMNQDLLHTFPQTTAPSEFTETY